MSTVILASAFTLAICGYHIIHRRARRSAHRTLPEQTLGTHGTEPASLHPVIDPELCSGCGRCVEACPEHQILRLVDGKARLVDPTHCIGHGACKSACSTGALKLMIGTATRGVDLPHVTADFQTAVPGVFVAGELGGMGRIANAIEQGRRAVESIGRLPGAREGEGLDLVVIGAGPAGISASLAAMEQGLRSITVEQDSLGGAVAHYPRDKIVMARPAHLPIVGRVQLGDITKQQLMLFWKGVEQQTGLKISYRERVERVQKHGSEIVVRTERNEYRTRAVLLAIGRRGTPRKLGVAGEESSKVTYRLIDPRQYRGKRVLVVGGGDSALEAAVSCAEECGTTVTLSCPSAAFGGAKQENRRRVRSVAREGRLRVLMNSEVREIRPDAVILEQERRCLSIPNDAVIVCAGGLLPTPLLREIGIELESQAA